MAQKSQESALASVRSAIGTTIMVIIIIISVAVLASVGLSRWIGISITAPVNELMLLRKVFRTVLQQAEG